MSGSMQPIEGAPYTMAEAMTMLDCSEASVVACIDRGELAAIRRGRSWVFPRAAFLESLDEIARAEAAKRRAEHGARAQTKTAIKKAAKEPSRARGRTPPSLPALP